MPLYYSPMLLQVNKLDRQKRHSAIDKQTLLLREISVLLSFVSREIFFHINSRRLTERSAGSQVDANEVLCKITVI